MRRTCVNFVLLAVFCSVLSAEVPAPVDVDIKLEPSPISVPDILTDLPLVEETPAVVAPAVTPELQKAVEEEAASAEEKVVPVVQAPAPVVPISVPGEKEQKVAPVKSFFNGGWPQIQVTQIEEDHRPPPPHSTAEGVCRRLCEKSGKGFLYVRNDECWCRCVIPECSGSDHGSHDFNFNFKSIAPALRNSQCREHCRSIHSDDVPDGFYDRSRDRCVCQCTPCTDSSHSKCN